MCVLHKPLAIAVTLVLLAGLAIPVLAAETKGRVVSVNPEKNEFVLTENFKNLTFVVNNASRVLINNRESKLADIQAGDEAAVTFERDGTKLIASVVRCTRKQ